MLQLSCVCAVIMCMCSYHVYVQLSCVCAVIMCMCSYHVYVQLSCVCAVIMCMLCMSSYHVYVQLSCVCAPIRIKSVKKLSCEYQVQIIHHQSTEYVRGPLNQIDLLLNVEQFCQSAL